MEAVRDAWTDERLDDLNHRVDVLGQRMDLGFAEVRQEFRAVRTEMATEFGAVRAEMAAANRTLAQVGVGMFATTIIGFAITIATILAHG
jgi:hypothetical protein